MPSIKRVGHLVINVRDQQASTKFYTEVLGFEVAVNREGFGTFLTCGKIHHDLALFQAAPDAAPITPGALGLNHMALQVEDFETLTEYYHKLEDHKIEMRTTDHSMTRSIYISDPDGKACGDGGAGKTAASSVSCSVEECCVDPPPTAAPTTAPTAAPTEPPPPTAAPTEAHLS